MNEELFRNKLMISSPTSISLGHITWFALDTKLVGRVKALLEERDNLQSKIDKANELIKRKLSTETYQHLKKLYDDIDSTEEIWEDYEFEDLQDILKEDK